MSEVEAAPVEGEVIESNESIEESQEISDEVGSEELSEEELSEEVSEEGDEEGSSEEGGEESVEEAIRKLVNIKMNGEDKEFDLDDERSLEELIKLAQMGGGAHAKMQEAAGIKKGWDSLEELAKTNPEEFLRQYGHDPEALAEEIMMKQIEQLKKSPETVEREKLENELQEARKQLKDREEREKSFEMDKLQREASIQLSGDISKALDNYKELPKSEYVNKRVAEGMLWALENGFDEIEVEDIVPVIHQEIQRELQELLEAMPEEAMENFIGRRSMDRMRKSRIKKSKQGTINTKTRLENTGETSSNESKEPAKKMTMREFLNG